MIRLLKHKAGWLPLTLVIALMLVASPSTAQTDSPLTLPQETGPGEMVAGEGLISAQQVTVEYLDTPPQLTPEQQQLIEAHNNQPLLPGPPLRVDPNTADLVAQPNVPETIPDNSADSINQSSALEANPITSGPQTDLPPPKPQAPGDYRFYRSKDLRDISTINSNFYMSSTNEPNLDARGDAHFMSGNWYAAFSTDRGQYYRFVNPFTTFPASDGGFCCDQLVIYDESRDLMFWLLQYIDSGGTNRQRLAVIHGSDLDPGMSGADWTYYDFTPANLGLGSNRWFDYPKMALSNNYLYINTNVYNTSDVWTNSAAWRIPLSQLDAGGSINFSYFTRSDTGSLMPTDGATTTMYWGTHTSLSQVRIYRWAESSSTLFWDNVNISSWTAGSYSCTTPDGKNPCGRTDGRMLAGWVANSVIGFMWGSNADGGTYTYPYVNAARFNQSNRTLISQPRLWSSSTAWIYPSLGVNNRGHLAGPVFTSGGGSYPTLRIIVADDYSGTPPPWENYFVRASTHGPQSNRWGDYVSSRRHELYPNTWVSAGFTLQGGTGNSSTHPQIIWHGRERDQPPASPSNDDITNAAFPITSPSSWTQSTIQATSAVDDPLTSCGSAATRWQSRSVWYSFTPTTTGNYQISTNGSNYDTVLAVWTGSRGSLTQRGCDDDGGTGTQSSLTLNLNSGTTYYIEAMRYSSGPGGQLDLSLTMITPPSPPTNVQATDGVYTDRVQVTWNASSGATYYQVYRATSAGGTKTLLGSPTGTSFNDTSAVVSTTYYYWVKACNGSGCSGFSSYNTGWRKPPIPAAPTNVQASDDTYTDRVQVSWNASSGATYYEVYRATSSGGAKTLLDSPTSSPYDDTTAAPGITYYYWVKACNTSGCSGFSSFNTGRRSVAPPEAPTSVQASDGTFTDKVQVSWVAPSGATSYEVHRATSAGGSKTLLASPTSASWADTTAVLGTTYYYWIKACNSGGCSDFSLYDIGWVGGAPTGPAVDVYLLVDLSSSFRDDLPFFKAQAPVFISTLRALNSNIQFGLGKFEDYPIDPFGSASSGDQAYERLVDLTFDTSPILSTIDGLSVRFGKDFPESQLPALYQSATGAGQDLSGVGYPGASIPAGQQATFRSDAKKIIILWTDASFHQPGDPGDIPYPGPSFAETSTAINALGDAYVFGIFSGISDTIIETSAEQKTQQALTAADVSAQSISDLEKIVSDTDAFAGSSGVDCNGDGTIDILPGHPLICTISATGEGIGEAVIALVPAPIGPPASIPIYLPFIVKN